ncbi:MAG: hypothetical protein ACI856_002469, partial [Kiritimatiellia bacterium]
ATNALSASIATMTPLATYQPATNDLWSAIGTKASTNQLAAATNAINAAIALKASSATLSAATNALITDIASKLPTNTWQDADSTTNYLPRTGGTMSGALTLPAGGLTLGTTQLVITAEGYVGIGVSSPTNELAVNGTIKARELIVTLSGWPDYVFEKGYELMPLVEVERYIREHGHLPNVPSARHVETQGLAVGDMHAVLLRKIEEMSLHLIRIERENAALNKRLQDVENRSTP